MDRSERKARIEELETWIRDTNTTYENDAMPDAVRLEWDTNNDELDQHRKVMKELEARGIVERTVIPGPPLRVEYALSEMGRELEPALSELQRWAERWLSPHATASV